MTTMPSSYEPLPPPPGRRRHPALRARTVAGATSALAMVGLTGYLAATGGATTDQPDTVEEALPAALPATTAATTTPTTTRTTVAASSATAAKPSSRRSTVSRGS